MRRTLITVAIVGLVGAPAAAQISIFNLRNSLVQFALEQISTPGLTITAEDVIDPEEGGTQLVGVKVADGEGVWLEIDRLTLAWNARRILVAELEINELSASGVRVLRQPAPVEVVVEEGAEIAAEDGEPFDWPRSPIATRIEELRLDRVFIAPGVIAAPSIAFDATGNLVDEGDEQSLQLRVSRTDAVEGRIALDYLRDFAANTLLLDLDAREDAGGLVAALAGLPEASASRVRVDAQGPLTDWSLDFSAETERVFTAQGQARIDLEGAIEARAVFTLVPGPEIDATAATLIGQEARLDIDIAEEADGVVRIRQGRLQSPSLTAQARGTYARRSGAADLSVVLEGGRGLSALAEGVDFAGFGFEGRVAGTPEQLTANGAARLDGLTTAPADVGQARLNTQVNISGERIAFTLGGTATDVRIDRLQPETLGPADLRVRGVFDGSTLDLAGFSFASGLLTASAGGEIGLEADTAALDYSLSAADLSPIARAYDTDASGALRVTGAITGALSSPRLTGEARLSDLRFEREDYGEVALGHDVRLGERIEGSATLDASGSRFGPLDADASFTVDDETAALSSLRALALGVTIEGALDYDLRNALANGAVTVEAPDLAPLSAFGGTEARGSLSGRLDLTPVAGQQDVGLDLRAEDVGVLDVTLARLDVEGTVEDALGAPSLDLSLDAAGARAAGVRLASLSGKVAGADLLGAGEARYDLRLGGFSGFGATLDAA
ncbi:MAG: hypothetical protein AAGI34_03775, partial [Pseudomonadota bacterium]